jgi:hypothetical protein
VSKQLTTCLNEIEGREVWKEITVEGNEELKHGHIKLEIPT